MPSENEKEKFSDHEIEVVRKALESYRKISGQAPVEIAKQILIFNGYPVEDIGHNGEVGQNWPVREEHLDKFVKGNLIPHELLPGIIGFLKGKDYLPKDHCVHDHKNLKNSERLIWKVLAALPIAGKTIEVLREDFKESGKINLFLVLFILSIIGSLIFVFK